MKRLLLLIAVTFLVSCNTQEEIVPELPASQGSVGNKDQFVTIVAGKPVQDPLKGQGLEAKAIDPNYIPSCQLLNLNTNYTISGTATGSWYCFSFQTVTNTDVKMVSRLFNQATSEMHDLYLLQWNPLSSSHDVVASSTRPLNDDEIASVVSDEGDYTLYISAVQSSGQPFSFSLQNITNFDDYEVNDTGGEAHSITSMQVINGNIDTIYDFDFFSYTTGATETKIDVFAQLGGMHLLYVLVNGVWEEFESTPGLAGNFSETYNVGANTEVLFAVIHNNDYLASSYYYNLVVQETNIPSYLTNLNVLSLNDSGNWFNQHMPFLNKNNQGQKADGAYKTIKFLGRLHGSNGPAAYQKVTLDYRAGNSYHSIDLFTDHDGWFEHTRALKNSLDLVCQESSSKLYTGYSYPTPDTLFVYEKNNYSITFNTLNGLYTPVDNEVFFWLCRTSAPDNYTYWD